MKEKNISAAEFLAQLENDPEYQKMKREKEKVWAEQRRILDEDQKELVSECQAVGYPIKSVWDFVNSEDSYLAALPILVEHLGKDHHKRVRQGIVRALLTPEASGVVSAEPIIKQFCDEVDSESELKWLLGSAIANTATLADAMTICDLMEDENHGKGREDLPLALIHCPKEAALAILEPLVKHPVMGRSASEAIKILAKH